MGVKAQDIYDVMDRFEAGSATRLKLAWEGVELELEKAQAPTARTRLPGRAGSPLGAVGVRPGGGPGAGGTCTGAGGELSGGYRHVHHRTARGRVLRGARAR